MDSDALIAALRELHRQADALATAAPAGLGKGLEKEEGGAA